MNVLILTGNLGKDAVQRFTPDGDSVVSFSVPASSGYGDKKKTSWVNCTMFGKRGDSVLPYLKKGSLVGVSGEFSMNEWTDKEGAKRLSPELRVSDLSLLGRKPENREQAAHQAAKAQGYQPQQPESVDDFADDIPFLFNMNTLCDTMGQPLSLWRARYGKVLSVVQANKTDF